VSRSLGDRNYA